MGAPRFFAVLSVFVGLFGLGLYSYLNIVNFPLAQTEQAAVISAVKEPVTQEPEEQEQQKPQAQTQVLQKQLPLITKETELTIQQIGFSEQEINQLISEQQLNQRFTGLLSHVHWLLNNRTTPNPDTQIFPKESLVGQVDRLERQIFSFMDDSADDLSDLSDDLQDEIDAISVTDLTNPTITGTLFVDGNAGIGTSSPSDTLAVAGAVYLGETTPASTVSRLYNTGGNLYWNGVLVGAGAAGNWTEASGNVYRATGNVGIGTSSPYASLSVVGGAHITGTITGATWNGSSLSDAYVDNNITASNYLPLTSWYATTTDGLAQGSTNLYFTNALADARFAINLAATSTTALAEGANLYWTDNRFDTRLLATSSLQHLSVGTSSVALSLNGFTPADYLSLAGWYATTTDGLAEGSTNRYYNTNLFAADLTGTTTDALAEGSTNLYFTNTRFDNRLAATTSLPGITTLANLSITESQISDLLHYTTTNFASDLAGTTTDALAQGSTNLYFTNALADARFAINLAATSTTALAEGTNLYWTDSRFDSRLLATSSLQHLSVGTSSVALALSGFTPADYLSLAGWYATTTDGLAEGSTNLYYNTNLFAVDLAGTTTTALAEGSNLYYTDARVASYISGSSSIPNLSGSTFGDLLTWTGSAWTTGATSTLGLGNGTFTGLSDTQGSLISNRIVFTNSGGTALTDNANFVFDGTNVGIGTTTPSGKLHVYNASAGSEPTWLAYDNVITESDDHNGIQVFTPNDKIGFLGFSDPEQRNAGLISYSHSLDKLFLTTNGNTQFAVDSVGNVGIGTTSPYAKLSVAGNIVATGTIDIQGNATSTFAHAIQSTCFSTDGVSCITGAGGSGTVNNSTAGYVAYYEAGGTTVSGTSSLFISPGGLVGIGTTTPQDNYNEELVIANVNGSSDTLIGFDLDGTGAKIGLDTNPASNGIFKITNKTDTTDWLAIDTTTGYLGIGTTTPGTKLHVSGAGSDIRLTTTDTSISQFEIYENSTERFGLGYSPTTNSTFLWSTTGGNKSMIDLLDTGDLVLQPTSGYVGISTTTPLALLTIGSSTSNNIAAGNYYNSAYVSGDLEVDGTIYGSLVQSLAQGNVFVGNAGNNAVATSSLFIDSNGFVGIGTTGPNTKLHVTGSLSVDNTIYDSVGTLLAFGNDEDNIDFNSGQLYIRQSDGYVGIGTTTPDQVLNVYRATGDVRIEAETDGASDSAVFKATRGSTAGVAAVGYATDETTYFGAGLTNSSTGYSIWDADAGDASRFFIDGTSGYVGIGTTTPTEALSVIGNGTFRQETGVVDLHLETGDSGTSSISFEENEQGNNFMLRYSGNKNRFDFVSARDSLPQEIIQMSILRDSGYLGLATTTPLARLTVGSSTPSALSAGDYYNSAFISGLLEVGGTATSTFAGPVQASCFTTDGSTCITGAGGSGTVNNSTAGYAAYYAANGTAVSGTSTLFIASDGRIGIGTTTPDYELNLLTDISNGGIKIEGTDTVAGLFLENSDTGGRIYSVKTTGGAAAAGQGKYVIKDETADVTRFVIDSSGNVGIGTTSPYRKLSVEGLINTDGTIGGYQIDGQTVLYASSTNETTLVGIGAGAVTDGGSLNNTFVGYRAGNANTTGDYNTAVGRRALEANDTGRSNVAVGENSLTANTSGKWNNAIGGNSLFSNTTGEYNNAFGVSALYNNTTGDWNNAFGGGALSSNTTGTSSVAIGDSALYSNTVGFQNNAVGESSLFSNVNGYWNNAFGAYSLVNNTNGYANNAFGDAAMYLNTSGRKNNAFGDAALYSNTSGYSNVAMGPSALFFNTTGTHNVAIGHWALSENTTGASSTAIGHRAGDSNTTGSNNTFIGFYAGYGDGNSTTTSNLSNATAIGNYAQVTASDSLVLGGTGSYAVNVGIGTTSPGANLEISTAAGSFPKLRFSSGDVVTSNFINSDSIGDAANSGTFGQIRNHLSGTADNTDGGLLVEGFTSTSTNDWNPLYLLGMHGGTNPTSSAAVVIAGQRYNGATNRTALTGSMPVLDIESSYLGTNLMRVQADGNVGIGSTSPAYKLTVGGNVYATSFIDDGVTIGAPDYVFDDPAYVHLSMEEIETFIEENDHLPWLTPRQPGPMALSARINEVLEALENLFLRVFDLVDWNDAQDVRIAELEAQVAELTSSQVSNDETSEATEEESGTSSSSSSNNQGTEETTDPETTDTETATTTEETTGTSTTNSAVDEETATTTDSTNEEVVENTDTSTSTAESAQEETEVSEEESVPEEAPVEPEVEEEVIVPEEAAVVEDATVEEELVVEEESVVENSQPEV